MRTWSDLCLICAGQQDFVVNVHEAGPYERSHDYTRVLYCPQHVHAYDTSVRVHKTRLPEHGPDRHSPAGRSVAAVAVVDGLVEFRSA